MRIWDAINPVELTGYVRAALADLQVNAFTLGRWLPNREVADLEFRFLNGGQGLAEAATFRSWDTESPIGKRKNVARVSGELPPISRKIRLGEYERMRLRGGVAAGDANDEIRNQVYNDGVQMTRAIAAREEMARGEALYSGKVVLNENGVVATIDFGRTGGHTVTAGTLWSDTTNADPLGDMIAWQTTYNTTNGQNPAAALTSTTAFNNMLKNAKIRDLLRTGPSTITRVSRADLAALIADFGLPPVEIYDAQVSVAGSAVRVIPVNRFLYLPAPDPNPDTNELGATLYGVPAGALDNGNFTPTDQPGVYAASYLEESAPHGKWTEAEAVAIPVEANPNLTFGATVG